MLSSDLILDAELGLRELERAGETAAPCGPDGLLTYVWRRKVQSPNPGYCYKVAGYRKIGTCKRGAKDLLWKPIELAGIAACGVDVPRRDLALTRELEPEPAPTEARHGQ